MDSKDDTDISTQDAPIASMSPADEGRGQGVQIAEHKDIGNGDGPLAEMEGPGGQLREVGEDGGQSTGGEKSSLAEMGNFLTQPGSQHDASNSQPGDGAALSASLTAPCTISPEIDATPLSRQPESDENESSNESDSDSDTDSLVSMLEDIYDFGDDHSLDCQCGVHVEGSANTTYEDDLFEHQKTRVLEGLQAENPGIEEVLRRLRVRETAAREATEKEASAAGIILLPPAEVTIQFDEETKGIAGVKVPLQVKYTGIAPVIPSSLADTSCATLGLDGMLAKLNEVLRTTYTLQTPGLSTVLQSFVACGCDFGTAYGQLRPFWFSDISTLLTRLEQMKEDDVEKRQSVLDMERKQVKQMDFPPRRVWDLYSDRIVPWWAFCQDYTLYHDPPRTNLPPLLAVSHSWMEESLRHNIDTSINGHEWPVPIPVDIDLEQIRIELLNHGAQYAWLDVLCLRQAGDDAKEPIRKQEWGLDVPIIGSIYRYFRKTITYFSGLGRPFYIGDLSSVRHWMNRAWTLQEANGHTIVGGLVSDSPFPPMLQNGRILDPETSKFYDSFAQCQGHKMMFEALKSMQKRAAVNELDKIAGLAYCTGYPESLRPLVLYKVQDGTRAALEEAWAQLVETLDPTSETWSLFLFIYPAAGDFGHTWRPSWRQTQTTLLPSMSPAKWTAMLDDHAIEYSAQDKHFLCSGYLLSKCTVKGLAETKSDGYCRMGTIKVRHGTSKLKFYVSAHHQQPIAEGTYSLMTNMHPSFWVVGRMTDSGALEKVSVIESEWDDNDELKELAEWATVRLV
ncbi:hypothetical protein NM688_g2049 [Phlebia brevispora]|uniref:Uncharacterized protein n=1 Tax=Phlebia brevispora TaxID=194682 RepID=A0ACC1T9Q2_9APHY|nr:hypothetical protein NM688_g2049 [Phlebia brevispora]